MRDDCHLFTFFPNRYSCVCQTFDKHSVLTFFIVIAVIAIRNGKAVLLNPFQ